MHGLIYLDVCHAKLSVLCCTPSSCASSPKLHLDVPVVDEHVCGYQTHTFSDGNLTQHPSYTAMQHDSVADMHTRAVRL